MKKNKLIVVALMISALFVATSAIAEDITTTAGTGQLSIGTTAGSNTLTIGLSKGVETRWVNAGTDASTAQFYVTAAVHSGGNKGYATAKNLTNIMVKDYNPGDLTSTILASIPVNEASTAAWPDGWGKQ